MPHHKDGASAPELIDASIAEFSDWRGDELSRVRALIQVERHTRRAIDLREGDDLDEDAFTDRVRLPCR